MEKELSQSQSPHQNKNNLLPINYSEMPLKVVKDSVVAAVDTATEEVAAAASEVVEAEVSAAEVEEEATEGVDEAEAVSAEAEEVVLMVAEEAVDSEVDEETEVDLHHISLIYQVKNPVFCTKTLFSQRNFF